MFGTGEEAQNEHQPEDEDEIHVVSFFSGWKGVLVGAAADWTGVVSPDFSH